MVVENLSIGVMTASARGTVEKPGRNVRQKAGLNRSILANGWAGSVTMLSYKLPALGGEVVKEWAAYSSQTCWVCQHRAPENRESQAVFRCMACGHAENADTNAAGVLLGRYRRRGSTPAQDVEGRGCSLPAKRQLDDLKPQVRDPKIPAVHGGEDINDGREGNGILRRHSLRLLPGERPDAPMHQGRRKP